MGLLTVIRKLRLKEKAVRVLMVGLDNAGKTTVVKSITGEDPASTSPTLGFSIKSLPYAGYTLNIWDVGGQRSLRSYWRNYFEKTDALVWVVDSSDLKRLHECRGELHQLLQEERLAGASLLVLANKQDIPEALSLEHIHEVLALDKLGNRHRKVVACSALRSDGLLAAFDWLVADVSRAFRFAH